MTSPAEKLSDDYWQQLPEPLHVVPSLPEATGATDLPPPNFVLEKAGAPVPSAVPTYGVELNVDLLARTLAESARTRVVYDRATDLLYRHRYPTL